MDTKITSYFSLSNRFVFGFVSFVLIFFLTLINNYYFYSHVERTTLRQALQLEKLLLAHINLNPNSNKDELQKELLIMIKNWKEYSYYNSGLMVIDFNNKEYELKKFKKWDLSASSNILINFNKLYDKKENGFILNSSIDSMQVLLSVLKSMTFSIDDIYKDIIGIKHSNYDGQIISIEDAKQSDYDGIITINGDKFKDIKGAKNIVIIEQNTSDKKQIYIPAFNELKVTPGMFIKKGDELSRGTIHTAVNNFQEIYWFRSRPFIGFAVFTFLLLFLFTKRAELLQKLHLEQLNKYEEKNKRTQQELEDEIEKRSILEEEILLKQNKLDEERKKVCNQFQNYQNFVKFAFLDTSIEELLEKNNRVLGTMFRLIAEKIVFSIYEKRIKTRNQYDNLDFCLKEISNSKILSKNSINALYSVKQFGNNSAHYSIDNEDISLIRTIVVARDLIVVIEEYLNMEIELENVIING